MLLLSTLFLSIPQFSVKNRKCALRTYMSHSLAETRREQTLSQTKFSERLMIDTRSYVDLERGECLCCTLTFVLFLMFCFLKETQLRTSAQLSLT